MVADNSRMARLAFFFDSLVADYCRMLKDRPFPTGLHAKAECWETGRFVDIGLTECGKGILKVV